MTRWAAFVGLTAVLITFLLVLTHLTQRLVAARGDGGRPDRPGSGCRPGQSGSLDTVEERNGQGTAVETRLPVAKEDHLETFSTGALLANVGLTQGLIALTLLLGAWFFGVPAEALGITLDSVGDVSRTALFGGGLGLGLFLLSETATTVAEAMGLAHDEALRTLLAPTTTGGWVVLLGLALPTVVVGEELLFRAGAIGVPVTGFGTPAWAMALISSVAFAFCHGIQGRVGILITGLLGLALAGAFVHTESLLLVVVAHYVLNATEFLVHEWGGVDSLAVGT
ncbi:MAG: type II CAAX prenyl endopeptidase Rce1 family protein [Halorhabdus sp.]